jgi:hypothetical protein
MKEISESHACYGDPHARVGQNRSEKDIIPEDICTRGKIVSQARTKVATCRHHGGVGGRAVGIYV